MLTCARGKERYQTNTVAQTSIYIAETHQVPAIQGVVHLEIKRVSADLELGEGGLVMYGKSVLLYPGNSTADLVSSSWHSLLSSFG